MQWLDVYRMSMEEYHAKLEEEELGEDDDKVYSTQVARVSGQFWICMTVTH